MAEGAGPEVVAVGEDVVFPSEGVADGDVVVFAAGIAAIGRGFSAF